MLRNHRFFKKRRNFILGFSAKIHPKSSRLGPFPAKNTQNQPKKPSKLPKTAPKMYKTVNPPPKNPKFRLPLHNPQHLSIRNHNKHSPKKPPKHPRKILKIANPMGPILHPLLLPTPRPTRPPLPMHLPEDPSHQLLQAPLRPAKQRLHRPIPQ